MLQRILGGAEVTCRSVPNLLTTTSLDGGGLDDVAGWTREQDEGTVITGSEGRRSSFFLLLPVIQRLQNPPTSFISLPLGGPIPAGFVILVAVLSGATRLNAGCLNPSWRPQDDYRPGWENAPGRGACYLKGPVARSPVRTGGPRPGGDVDVSPCPMPHAGEAADPKTWSRVRAS